MLYLSRRFGDAISQVSRTLQLDPTYAMTYLPLGLSLLHRGRTHDAIAALCVGLKLAGNNAPYYRAALGLALGAAREEQRARTVLQAASSFDRALVHLGLDEKERAISCLEQAVAEGSTHLAYLYADPMFDGLRREPPNSCDRKPDRACMTGADRAGCRRTLSSSCRPPGRLPSGQR
jgi:tetratricopeptide (TPR) repeat protein